MLYLEEEESAFVWHGPFFLLKLKRLSAKPVGTVVTMAVLSGGADPDKAFSFRLMTGNMLRPKSWPPTWKNTACFPSHPPFVGVEILLLGPSPFPSTSIFFFGIYLFIYLFIFWLFFSSIGVPLWKDSMRKSQVHKLKRCLQITLWINPQELGSYQFLFIMSFKHFQVLCFPWFWLSDGKNESSEAVSD